MRDDFTAAPSLDAHDSPPLLKGAEKFSKDSQDDHFSSLRDADFLPPGL
jgi:hypothetical protein